MALFDLLARTERLSPANLTIREQTRLLENPHQLRWRAIFPKVKADSYKLSELTTVDFRPVGGRRAFDAPGREMPERFGPARDFRMSPINPTKHINEERLQQLRERSGKVAELIAKGIIKDVDAYATFLADAVDWQLEVDAFEAWFLGQITVHDPEAGAAVTVDLKFDPKRYPVEVAPWTDAGVNSFDRLVYHLGEAQNLMGSVAAVRMRRLALQQLVKDAPVGFGGVRPTLANVEARLAEEGYAVKLVVDERTYDKQVDGSSNETVPTKLIPVERIAMMPESGRIGSTHMAEVTRAYDYVAGGGDRVDLNDVVVFHTPKNEGKTLMVEAEAIAAPLPVEKNLYVVDTGIAEA